MKLRNIVDSWTGARWDRPTRTASWAIDSPLDRALASRIAAEAGLEHQGSSLEALARVDQELERHPARGPRMKSALGLAVMALVCTGADLRQNRQVALAGLEALNRGPHTPAMAGLLRAAGATLGHVDVEVLRDRVLPLLAVDPSLLWERSPDAVRQRVQPQQSRWRAAMKRFDALLDRVELRMTGPGEALVLDGVPAFFRRQLALRLHERYRRPVRVDGQDWGGWTLSASGRLEHEALHMNRARQIAGSAPWGPGNPAPLWIVSARGLSDIRPLKRSHVKADLGPVDLVWWGGRRHMERLPTASELLAELRVTQWQGIERPQLVVRDAR